MGTNAYYLNQFISTTLATVGGIDDSQTTGIILTSVTGVETTKPGIVCLSYSDPIDTSKAEWISYTSISVTNELQGVTRGAEGFSAKSHSNGVTIAFPISESHINNLNDALIIGGSATNLATGVIDDDTFATASATTLATSESIKAYSDSATQTLTNKTLDGAKTTGILEVEGGIRTTYTTTSCPNNTATTTHTFGDTVGFFFVSVWLPDTAVANYYAYAIIATDVVGSGEARILTQTDGSNTFITLSGMNLQVRQTSGGTQTMRTSILRIV